MVLEIKSDKFKYLFGEFNTLVFRIPKYTALRNFIKKVGPIVSTSANVSGQKPIVKLEELEDKLKEQVDFFVDAGQLKNPPSTIISFLR